MLTPVYGVTLAGRLTMGGADMPEEETRARIVAHLAAPADRWVHAYFEPSGPFAGDTFDTLGDNDRDRVTSDDLLAVSLLDVRVRPPAVRTMLGAGASHLSGLLREIDDTTDLWDASDELLGYATTLWDHLRSFSGIDWVTAGKLLARKRPRLVPVVDSVVIALVPAPRGKYWRTLRSALAEQGVRDQINALRPDGLDTRVSTLRVLDVALWMRGSNGRNARAIRAATSSAASGNVRPVRQPHFEGDRVPRASASICVAALPG